MEYTYIKSRENTHGDTRSENEGLEHGLRDYRADGGQVYPEHLGHFSLHQVPVLGVSMYAYQIRYTLHRNPSKVGSLFDTVRNKKQAGEAVRMLEGEGFKAWYVRIVR